MGLKFAFHGSDALFVSALLLLGMSTGCSGGSSSSNSGQPTSGSSAPAPKTMARQGYWKGWFNTEPDNAFWFYVQGDAIYNTKYGASTSTSVCTVIAIGQGSQKNGSITEDRFSYTAAELNFTGTFLDVNHAQVSFTGSPTGTGCGIASGHLYDAYAIEDPCGPDIPVFRDLGSGTLGGRRAFTVSSSMLISDGCDTGVPDGTPVELSIEDTDATGTTIGQSPVVMNRPVNALYGNASATLIFGSSPGSFYVIARVPGIAPSARSDRLSVK